MVSAKDVQGVMAMMPSFSTKDASELTAKNTIDVDNLKAGVDKMINDGIDVITTTGSFGECYNLTWDEYKTLASAAVDAVKSADWLVFGPGSWFTSVIPHLLVPDLADAITASFARRLVTLNLAAELETAGLSLPDHLRALARYLPGLRVDVVLADGKAVGDPEGLATAAQSLRARVVFAPVAVADGGARHDPVALASALYEVLRMADSPDRPRT